MDNSNTTENNCIILNAPNKYNLLDLLPQYSQSVHQHKLLFLVHQINYFTSRNGYSINIKKHDWLFGEPQLTQRLLDDLIKAGVIYQHKGYVIEKHSTLYKMVKAYDIKFESDIVAYYYDNINFPQFLKKWVADDFKVMNAKTTTYTKDYILPMTPKEVSAEVTALKNKVAQLEAKVIELRQNEVVYQTQIITSGVTINNLVEFVKETKINEPEEPKEYTVTLDYDDIDGALYFIEDMENVFNIVKMSNHQYNIDNIQLTVINKVITLTGKDKFDLNQTKKLIDKHLRENIKK